MRPARRPISLTKFCREELGPTWSAVADRYLDESASVTVEDATAVAFLLDVHVGFIQGIDRKYWAWVELESVKQKASGLLDLSSLSVKQSLRRAPIDSRTVRRSSNPKALLYSIRVKTPTKSKRLPILPIEKREKR